MSSHVVAFRPPDDRWREMKAVWDSCMSAGVPVPRDVEKFFDDRKPDETGVVVELRNSDALSEWQSEYASGFEVRLDKLPPEIKVLRFYNAW